ncbi:MAG: LAGLIDADG family homing endonuclease [Nanoarchaeota archaeon]
MDKGEKLALFLGMLSGDGCLSKGHNGDGYRTYPIQFCNTKKELVLLFNRLFYDIFEIEGHISSRNRYNRQEIWHFVKISRKIFEEIRGLGFPEGVKRDVLRVLHLIKNGTDKEKLLFIQGMLITDGYTTDKSIRFHLGSKLFLEDLSELIAEFIGKKKAVREYTQRQIYKSYQLSLNKVEKNLLLSRCGTMVLQ